MARVHAYTPLAKGTEVMSDVNHLHNVILSVQSNAHVCNNSACTPLLDHSQGIHRAITRKRNVGVLNCFRASVSRVSLSSTQPSHPWTRTYHSTAHTHTAFLTQVVLNEQQLGRPASGGKKLAQGSGLHTHNRPTMQPIVRQATRSYRQDGYEDSHTRALHPQPFRKEHDQVVPRSQHATIVPGNSLSSKVALSTYVQSPCNQQHQLSRTQTTQGHATYHDAGIVLNLNTLSATSQRCVTASQGCYNTTPTSPINTTRLVL